MTATEARRPLLTVGVGVVAGAIATETALWNASTGDYGVHGAVLGNNAAPALEALSRGSVSGFIAHQPTMGLLSLLLRAPIVALTRTFAGGDLLAYQLGCAVCLLSLAALATWLVVQRRRRPLGWFAGATATLLLLLSPAVGDALSTGHPEDVLAAALATGGVVVALRGRAGWAAVMVGAAAGSMPWAIIAAVPVLMCTTPEQRMRTALRIAGVTAPLTVVMPLADPAAFVHALRSEGHTNYVNVFSLWWSVSHPFHLSGGALAAVRRLPFGLSRSTATAVALLLGLALIGWVWIRGRREGRVYDPLATLVLLGVVRSLGDTTQLQYYKLAWLVPLAVWETETLGRPPFLAALATAGIALMPTAAAHVDPALLNSSSLALRVVLFAYMAYRAFGGTGLVAPRWNGLASRSAA